MKTQLEAKSSPYMVDKHGSSAPSVVSSSPTMQELLDHMNPIVKRIGAQPMMGHYMQHCSGILVLSAREYALAVSGQGGTGILLKHNQPGKSKGSWSLPVAVQMKAVGVGINLGYETKEMIIFLNDRQLKNFSQNATLRLGGEIGFSVRNAYGVGLQGDVYMDISDGLHVNSSGAFADTKGWKYTWALQAGYICPLWKTNEAFYGSMWDPKDPVTVTEKILDGKIASNASTEDAPIRRLHEILEDSITNKWVPRVYDSLSELEDQ